MKRVSGFIRTSRQSWRRKGGIGSRALDLTGVDCMSFIISFSETGLKCERTQVVGTDVDFYEDESLASMGN